MQIPTNLHTLFWQAHTHTHTRKTLAVVRTLTKTKQLFFVSNPLVGARPRAVTAHQSGVGGQSFDYLLHVIACVCSFRRAPEPALTYQPPHPPPPSLYSYPFHEGDEDLVPPLTLWCPTALPAFIQARILTHACPHTDFFFFCPLFNQVSSSMPFSQ